METGIYTKVFLAAAEQLSWQMRRRRDRYDIKAGAKIVHAIDTDIVILFINPREMSLGKDTRAGYAEIFPDENPDITLSLGSSLARFIFEELSIDIPLIIFPSTAAEIQGVFSAVLHQADIDGDKAFSHLDDFKNIINEISDIKNSIEASKKLSTYAEKIALFLTGRDDALAELERFGLLFNHSKLVLPENINNAEWHEVLEAPKTLYERIEFHELREEWFDKIKSEKSSKMNNTKIFSDAVALARIEWVNEKLARRAEENNTVRDRVVYITGDHAIHAAANKYMRVDLHERLSFGELYLRHPKSYLAEKNVLEPPVSEGNVTEIDTQIDAWLDTFFGSFYPGTSAFPDYLKEIVNKPNNKLGSYVKHLREQPEVFEKFLSSWKSYTSNIVIDRTPSSLELEIRNINETKAITDYQALIAKLEDAIHDRIFKVWNDCFYANTNSSGYSLLSASFGEDNKLCPRNAPLLTFDSFKSTKKFVKEVLKSHEKGEVDAEYWDEWLEKIQEEDDDSGYAFYLALGTLFAAKGVWRVAAVLANRALAIAKRENLKNITGREAAYLRAVSLRHTARRTNDLKLVEELLEKTQDYYEEDLRNRPTLKAAPCRFKSEILATYVTYHLFDIFLNKKNKLPSSVPCLENLLKRIEKTLSDIQKSEEDKDNVIYTERNLLINWVMASLLRVKEEGCYPDNEQFSIYQNRLNNNIEKGNDKVPASYYVEVIHYLGEWYLETDIKKKKADRKLLEKLLNSATAHDVYVMKYDKKRFEFIREFISLH